MIGHCSYLMFVTPEEIKTLINSLQEGKPIKLLKMISLQISLLLRLIINESFITGISLVTLSWQSYYFIQERL